MRALMTFKYLIAPSQIKSDLFQVSLAHFQDAHVAQSLRVLVVGRQRQTKALVGHARVATRLEMYR